MNIVQIQNHQLRHILIFALIVLALLSCVPRSTSRWKMEGNSMEPTLSDGELVVVEQIDLSKLRRGDMIVYEYNKRTYLKRLIGLPNETIEIYGGKIYINSKIYDEPYKVTQPSYEVLMLQLGNNEYYGLGDNRDNSADSHVFGPILAEQIIGRVIP